MAKGSCLISCVSKKLLRPAPAAELYTSDLFQKAQGEYATTKADHWFILSAEQGLLKPDTMTKHYNTTLNEMPIDKRRSWATKVLQSLSEVLKPGDEVTFLAGTHSRSIWSRSSNRRTFLSAFRWKGLGSASSYAG